MLDLCWSVITHADRHSACMTKCSMILYPWHAGEAMAGPWPPMVRSGYLYSFTGGYEWRCTSFVRGMMQRHMVEHIWVVQGDRRPACLAKRWDRCCMAWRGPPPCVGISSCLSLGSRPSGPSGACGPPTSQAPSAARNHLDEYISRKNKIFAKFCWTTHFILDKKNPQNNGSKMTNVDFDLYICLSVVSTEGVVLVIFDIPSL